MPENQNIAQLVNSMPDLDPAIPNKDNPNQKNRTDEFKLTGPNWTTAEKTYAAILAGGRDSIMSLIGMLSEGNDPAKYKPRYVLHGLALFVARPNNQNHRALLMTTLTSQLASDRAKWTQAILLRELEYFATKDAIPAIAKLLLDDELSDDAIRTILAIRDGAADPLRAALPSATARHRLALVQALGSLADPAAAPQLKDAAADPDPDTRQAALFALANIPDPTSVDLLIKSSDAQGYERIQNTNSCLLAAQKLTAIGKKTDADKIYKHLATTRTDKSEQYIKDIAQKALAN